MALTSGDVATGRLWAEEALELHRKLGDDWGTAFSLLMSAYAIGQEGDWPRAQQLFGESVGRFRDSGDEQYALRAARAQAWAYYEDGDLEKTLELVDTTSPYALTGAIFAEDRRVIAKLAKALRHAAGNFYINDKPTGAVVGQQPFGGARASGTNDKAGSMSNLLRWTSQRAIKENFVPPKDFRYPYMGAE